MSALTDRILTALAPTIWGSSYIVATEWLPADRPLTVAVMRALPAGLLLLVVVRQWPARSWYARLLVLGALNFSVFWSMLFIAAWRLPGGLAATLGAIQPLLVLLLARLMLGQRISMIGVLAAVFGLIGVGLLVVGPDAAMNRLGMSAALLGAASMAAGTVLTRRWQLPVSALTFTAWQLTAGGLLLLPVALLVEPALPMPTARHLAGYLWLGLIGAALTYFLWFRGIARLGPSTVTAFGFLSPLSAVLLGWLFLGQTLTPAQGLGAALVVLGVWLGQRAGRSAEHEVRPAPLSMARR